MNGPFRQLVFSGGGTRCFWHGGFFDVVRDPLGIAPRRVIGVSGGALSAASFLARRGHVLLRRMCEAFAEEDANATWHDLAADGGRTPHQRVYREVVEDVLDAAAQARIAEGAAFQVLLAHPPLDALARWTGTAMTLAYEAELHIRGRPHFDWAERLGVTARRVDARRAAAEGRLAELVIAAATIPPLFELPRWDGRPVIDGGMVDQAPRPEPDDGPTLVALTRSYRNLPRDPRLTHVEPSRETPADKIDFTDPDKLRRTWELGRLDGQRFLDKWSGKTKGG